VDQCHFSGIAGGGGFGCALIRKLVFKSVCHMRRYQAGMAVVRFEARGFVVKARVHRIEERRDVGLGWKWALH
jgi:hypothetical protein